MAALNNKNALMEHKGDSERAAINPPTVLAEPAEFLERRARGAALELRTVQSGGRILL